MFKEMGKKVGNFVDEHPVISGVGTVVGFFGTPLVNQAYNQRWNAYSNQHGRENHLMFGNHTNTTHAGNHINTNYAPATWEGFGWNLLANGTLPVIACFLYVSYVGIKKCIVSKAEHEKLINQGGANHADEHSEDSPILRPGSSK